MNTSLSHRPPGLPAGFLFALVVAACAACSRVPAAEDAPHPRVVALAPSLAELCFALGAGDHVVGVSAFCDRPPEASRLPVVGDSKGVALEALAALRPDLVLVNSEAHRDLLRPLDGRVDVLFVRTDSIEGLLGAIEAIGERLGRSREARALARRIEQAVAGARRRAARGADSPRVLVVLQRDPFFVAGPGSYVDEVLGLLGLRNAAEGTGSPWPTLSAEALLALAPDVILDAATDARRAGRDPEREVRTYWARFPSLPAVRAGRVGTLTDPVALRPGPSLPEGIAALEESIARLLGEAGGP